MVSCTIFLVGTAFIKGLDFEENASYTGGFVIPLTYVVLHNITIYYGLLAVGDTVIDPFGDDLEDFAILHFVEFTAKASYEAMYCNSYKADATFAANWKPPEAEPVPHRRFSLRQQGALLPRGQASLSPEGQALPSSAADAKGGDSQQGELELDQMEA